MISTQGLTLRFGKRVLFEDVNVKFRPGHCYGLIGANGAGKSTFIKCLSGEQELSSGNVIVPKGERLSILKQNHFEFDEMPVLKTVLVGHKELFAIMEEKDALYAKPDFSDEDGMKAADLEGAFADMNGWDAEPAAASLLSGLGVKEKLHDKLMAELTDDEKVRVLLAQALFGDPDILLLDEPTNHLDLASVIWLEEFLMEFKNTVVVVSHDRHFLNKVCTHIADIDYQKLTLYTGNYEFWYQSSQLAMAQRQDHGKKQADKVKELKEFISRFSANAAKSKQATARKKLLDKINIEQIKPSSRKYPHIIFTPERDCGKDILRIENICKTIEGEALFKNISFHVNRGDKIAIVGDDSVAISALFSILSAELKVDSGEVLWGQTVTHGYFPKENTPFFKDCELNLVDWLRQYSQNKEENFIRAFLGRMLFTGEESQKQAQVLSGGERVRCMLSKMMMLNPNVLLLDGPTNHLDLESITALNESLKKFTGTLLFSTHDVEFANSLATRVIEIKPTGIDDHLGTFENYMESRSAARS